ncbi:MAG: alpha/beta hydrolase [Magnetovibrio sp.]|nr:alpha/beta hydrolase [Magnetovibrio sp.]
MNKGIKSAMINVFVAAGVFYVAVVVFMYVFQRNVLYYPHAPKPTRVDSRVADMVEVTFTTQDGLDLFAWYGAATDPGKPTIVLFHGNAGTLGGRAFKARVFLDQGYGVMLAEYRGYSGNPGSPTEQGLYSDGRAALAYLRDQGLSHKNIVLYGESLGTGVATALAAEAERGSEGVAAVLLEAPFTSTVDAGSAHYPFLPVRFLMKDRFDSLSRIGNIKAPLFIVHGEDDWTVPTTLGRKLFKAANEPKEALWIEGAGHNNVFDYGAGPAMLDFLARHVPPVP